MSFHRDARASRLHTRWTTKVPARPSQSRVLRSATRKNAVSIEPSFSKPMGPAFRTFARRFDLTTWYFILSYNTRQECDNLLHAVRECNQARPDAWALILEVAEEANKKRWDPTFYLGQTFQKQGVGAGAYLLNQMLNTGMILSGSRALDFFLGGSATQDSDWDFYVPPSGRNVHAAMKALENVGVTWRTTAERVVEQMRSKQSTIMLPVRDVKAIILERNIQDADLITKLGDDLERLFRLVDTNALPPQALDLGWLRLSLIDGEYCIVPSDAQPHSQLSGGDIDDQLGEVETTGYVPEVAVVHGKVQTIWPDDSPKISQVQLIFDLREADYSLGSGKVVEGSFRTFRSILRFHSSHVQCFISGFASVHLYPGHLDERRSVAFDLSDQHPFFRKGSIGARLKYQARGFTFPPSQFQDLNSVHCLRWRPETLILRHRDILRNQPHALEAFETPRERFEYETMLDLSWEIKNGKVSIRLGVQEQSWQQRRETRSVYVLPELYELSSYMYPFGFLHTLDVSANKPALFHKDVVSIEDRMPFVQLMFDNINLIRYGASWKHDAAQRIKSEGFQWLHGQSVEKAKEMLRGLE